MTDAMYSEKFQLHYGSLQSAAKRGEIQLHTLSSLGLKRSVDAVRSGHILIRKSVTSGQKTLPAIWLKPADLPKFEAICLLSEHDRIATKELQLSQHEQKQNALKVLMINSTPLQQRMADDELKRQPNRSVERIRDDVNRLDKLIHAIEVIAAHEDLSLDMPIAAVKSTANLRYASDVPLSDGLCFKKEYWFTIPATSSPKELKDKFLSVQQAHTLFSIDIQKFIELAHRWKNIIPWSHWMAVFKKAKQDSWTLAQMIQRVLDASRTDGSASKKLQEFCAKNAQLLPLPDSMKEIVASAHDYTFITAQGLEIQGFPWGSVFIDAISDTTRECEPEQALQQSIERVLVQNAMHYAQRISSVHHRLRQSISSSFDEPRIHHAFYRFMPKSIRFGSFDSVFEAAIIQTIEHFSALLSVSDLVNKYGDDWVVSRYTHARALERRIVIFAGPTNSGKTYNAYKAVEHAQSVLYLAPLRLLAMEGYDKLVSMGFDAGLITGEERIGSPDSRYIASTVEMCNPNRIFDAAIIDEAQMLCDPDRGSAWTAAILGVPAKNVYLTCPEESVEMLLSLLRLTEENVEVVRLERKSSLAITQHPTPLKSIKPGTAFIAFSRRDLLSYKEVFEASGMKCALVYGALSPEVRRSQAQLFSSGQADVLLSTDAISMGLNLPIQHVVISDSKKFNGKSVVNVEPALLRQIAGRAGRYGIKENGLVSGLNREVHKSVVRAFEHVKAFHVEKFPIGLDHDMVEVLSVAYHTAHLAEIAEHFKKVIESSASDFVAKCQPIQAQMFGFIDHEHIASKLSLAQRFSASCAPVNDDNYGQWAMWVNALATGVCTSVPRLKTPTIISGDEKLLKKVENEVALLNVYRWMHYQFPHAFPDLEAASCLLREKDQYIHEALKKSIRKRCVECGCSLSMQWVHPRCDDCYGSAHDPN